MTHTKEGTEDPEPNTKTFPFASPSIRPDQWDAIPGIYHPSRPPRHANRDFHPHKSVHIRILRPLRCAIKRFLRFRCAALLQRELFSTSSNATSVQHQSEGVRRSSSSPKFRPWNSSMKGATMIAASTISNPIHRNVAIQLDPKESRKKAGLGTENGNPMSWL